MQSEQKSVDLQRWSTPATQRSIKVGALEVTFLPDGYVELEPHGWFSLAGQSNIISGHDHLSTDTGYLVGSIGSLLVTGPGLSVLIDAGFGPRTLPGAQSHAALGSMHGGGLAGHTFRQPLDAVCFTHLHEDHAGWLRAEGHPLQNVLELAPKFASQRELADHNLTGKPGWRMLGDNDTVAPGIRAVESPGHTRGHLSYLIESDGESLLCFGDVMHSPIQVAHPELNSCFEAVPGESLHSRRNTLEWLADSGMKAAGMHFGDVVFGTIARTSASYEWLPVS